MTASSLLMLLILALVQILPGHICSAADMLKRNIRLPPGFSISIYADNISDARSMTLSPGNILFVGSRKAGNVYAVIDEDGDKIAEKVLTIAKNLNMPNGIAYKDGDLYVAEVHRIIKFKDIEQRLGNPGPPEIVFASLPQKKWHGWRYIKFGPDGKLYISIGAPCNVCTSADPLFGTIARMDADGSNFEIFARGVRNSVGFDWHPQSRELWFTDNGRDLLGDDLPPDELNRAASPGLHFGFPYLHGSQVPDPEFGPGINTISITTPVWELGAHVASLGMEFYRGAMFPEKYASQVFIAEHGSWNRSVPVGYRISIVKLENSTPVAYEVFAEGWLQKNRVLGRPVDLEIMSDGSLLLSDDHSNRIYRIVYENPR